MIHEHRVGGLANNRREVAIQACITLGLVNYKSVIQLLTSFLDGSPDQVPTQLLQLMTSPTGLSTPQDSDSTPKIIWIPYLMAAILKKFGLHIVEEHLELSSLLSTVNTLFSGLMRRMSGDAWEYLFVIAIMLLSAVTK